MLKFEPHLISFGEEARAILSRKAVKQLSSVAIRKFFEKLENFLLRGWEELRAGT